MIEKLYEENTGLMRYWANRYSSACHDRADIDTEDLAQVAFIGLVQAAKSYQPERAAWGTWASIYIQSAIRCALGWHGKKQIKTVSTDEYLNGDSETTLGETIPDSNIPPSDTEIIASETRAALLAAIDEIKNGEARKAVKFHYLDGYSIEHTADRLGIEKSKIGGLLSSGRVDMRRNRKLRAALALDEETRFFARKSVAAFNRDNTSVVEAAVIWREEQTERGKHAESFKSIR